ncbi:uncharacterized protein LOC128205596 isoform X2 [Mya arenaria]|uniref:uncharacterized protein LOC128205596 isoform X2 n=1 Tax=Mya arenaria TaxID=6604 RepID=UPI0022E6C6F2|nr:uncharacterized protein LOC128205596 isoform X2 [Mya arenaria]
MDFGSHVSADDKPQMSEKSDSEDHTTQSPRQPSSPVTMTTLKQLLPKQPQPLQLSLSGTRSLPIHCIIEQTSGRPSFNTPLDERSAHTSVELDSYAILPGTTPISECVQSALSKLGYNPGDVLGATGAIQIKNWKPLSFDTITDNSTANIEDLLGELTQVATLRIRICSSSGVTGGKLSSGEEVKERLLQLLLTQSQSLLTGAGCNGMEKNGYTNGQQTLATISPEMRRAFDKWYEEQLKSYTEGNSGPAGLNLASAARELLAVQQQKISAAMTMTSGGVQDKLTPSQTQGHTPQVSPPVPRPKASSTPTADAFSHPAYQHYLPGKTRMRTSFDPECEIPRLQRWFAENQHPSREQMLLFLNELNLLDSRKGRRPLDLTNIIYWFKNARAAHRRATKNSSDDSFEMEDEKEAPSTGSGPDGIPFLPNRNAVYMVPYPHFPNISLNNLNNHLGLLSAHNKLNGQMLDREPCDLSLSGSRSKSPEEAKKFKTESLVNGSDRQSPLVKNQDISERIDIVKDKDNVENSPQRSDEGYSEMVEKSPSKSCSPEQDDNPADYSKSVKAESHEVNDMPTDLTVEKEKSGVKENIEECNNIDNDVPNDLSVKSSRKMSEDDRSDSPTDLRNSNGKRAYESDDDDNIESDYDDDQSIGSASSHDEAKLAALRESYLNSAHLNLGVVTSSPSSQPLHIPQFPHPLAMHYFPMNTHFYSQQSNPLKYPAHQQSSPNTTPKSSPGGGQENNSSHSRKRRTRVFIDPLSEIPKLEKWFLDDTHPSSYMIDKYCEELNSSDYRQKFPKLEPKNVQLWFKNHRAKVKRMRVGGVGDHMFV